MGELCRVGSRTEPTLPQVQAAVNAPAITTCYLVANALSLRRTIKYVEFYLEIPTLCLTGNREIGRKLVVPANSFG